MRTIPYAAFAFFYSAGFIIAFSSVANFGILVRQRVQLLPLYLVLLSIPLPSVVESRGSHRAVADPAP
jgi:hypothetical protein